MTAKKTAPESVTDQAPGTDTVTMSRSELQALIEGALARAVPAAAPDAGQALVQTLTEALKGTQARRAITVGERGTPKTRFNPQGRANRLSRRYFVNTFELREVTTHDPECERLERLRAGTYCNGRFNVIIAGENTPTPEVHVMWDNSTPEGRVNIARDYGTFSKILEAILVDQDSQVREREDFAEYRRHKQQAPLNPYAPIP